VNLQETTYWAGDLLPGDPEISTRRVNTGFPEFTVAAVPLGGASDPEVPEETVAMTLDAARIEPGLVTADGADLRVEFITVTSGHTRAAADLVTAAASMVAMDPMQRSPQPGLLLPNLGWHVDETMTAVHGLLVPPFLWEDGVPHVLERDASGRHSSGPRQEYTHPGRMTVVAQLVMISEPEFRIASEKGVGALQQVLAVNGVNLNDVWR
jgi:hypothetical protein